MRKYAFAIRASIIMTALLALFSFMAIYAYERFSSTVNEIKESVRPDTRLINSKSLSNDINDAEINVKSFRITDDAQYLSNFYATVEKIEERLDNFYETAKKSNDLEHIVQLDSLNILIEHKINILNQLLFLQDGIRTQKALDEVVEKIEESAETDTIRQNIAVETSADEEKEKKRKFSWLFKNKKDLETETVKDSLIPVEIIRVERINDDLSDIRRKELRYTKAYKKKEIALILKDEEISQQLNHFFEKFEAEERGRLEKMANKTKLSIEQTNTQIAWLCSTAALLLLLVSFMFINYNRKNHKYNEVLEQAKQEAEGLSKSKQRFLANMSHEIRTPLNAIIGFSEQIGTSPLNKEQGQYLKMVRKSSDHLLHVLNEVLDFSRLEENKIELENLHFKIEDVVQELGEFVKINTLDKTVDYQFEMDDEIPPVLIGDPFRLRQILYNLLSNSLKFTENGSVQLSAKLQSKGTQQCKIQFKVSDTGIGISKNNLEKIFEDFEQASTSTSRNYGGTGLGLSIVKLLVELYKGKIQVHSNPGEGTTITITIDFKIGDEQEIISTQQELSTVSIPSNTRILIVDDEEFNRLLIVSICKKYGILFDQATNGEEALQWIGAMDYDLVLMDIRMPECNGKEATRRIRNVSDETKKSIPIIALTAAVNADDLKTYEEIGFNATLAKPFSEFELVQLLQQQLAINLPLINEAQISKNDIINFENLKELSSADETFYYDMIRVFINGTETGITDLIKALNTNNFEEAGEIAHKISTPCNHLGAKALYDTLKSIEKQCRDHKSVAKIPETVQRLNQMTADVLKLAEVEFAKK